MRNLTRRAAPPSKYSDQFSKFISFSSVAGAVIFIVTLLGAVSATADAGVLRSLLSKQGQVSVSVVDASNGQVLFEQNAHAALKPASVLKLATSLTALDQLGGEYRFSTEVQGDPVDGGRAATLVVRGGGDPSLNLESLWLLARSIRRSGVREVGSLYLDDGAFVSVKQRQGQRAYEAGSSALAFNYNSVAINVCPTKPGKAAVVSADPWEAGTKIGGSIATISGGGGVFDIEDEGGDIPGGSFRVSGSIGVQRGCEQFYRSLSDTKSYFAEVFSAFLNSAGVKAKIAVGPLPQHLPTLFVARSKTLSEIIAEMNHFSTNFTAEQILYAIGSDGDGRNFDREAGLQRVSAFLERRGISRDEFQIVDGSGLSHNNRLSANALTKLLTYALHNEKLRPEFENSLSIAGKSGTLKRRDFGNPETMILRGKTGTLDGVSSLAGYLTAKSGRRIAFAIVQNQVASKPQATQLEDEFIEGLYPLY